MPVIPAKAGMTGVENRALTCQAALFAPIQPLTPLTKDDRRKSFNIVGQSGEMIACPT